jgi:hypothetical protein
MAKDTAQGQPFYGYVVFRPAPGLPEGFLPDRMDGQWMDLMDVDPSDVKSMKLGDHGRARPTGRFEVRDSDGARAEVWEIRDERQ